MDFGYEDTIKFGDTEECRINRLERVIGYVCAVADYYGNNEILNKIEKLEDYEGGLIITWKKEPAQGEKECFSKAWESNIANEISDAIEHIIL